MWRGKVEPAGVCNGGVTEMNMGNQIFVIHILDQENMTWQGQISWLNKEETKSFRSMLEMIKMMDAALAEEKKEAGIVE